MTTVRVRVDTGSAIAGLDAAAAVLQAGVIALVRRQAAAHRTLVRAKASTGTHRPGAPHIPGTGPGPNVATGDYRRSITQTDDDGDGAGGPLVSEVSTNAVQAARLEYGFVGRDSAGRMFHQPAYPHWEPAQDESEEAFRAASTALGDRVAAVITGGST